MQIVADLHLHSRFSRAVSQQMNLPTMARYAKLKGLDLLSACDWTHPVWFKEIRAQLEETNEGIYTLKSQDTNSKKQIKFLLSTEIASIYKQGDKLRRIHNLVFAPSFEIAEKITKELLRRGCNLSADGRPIVGISSKDLLSMILEIDERCMLIPCHIWTPHFGIYGSASGFETLKEAFGELDRYIYGIETGLSSDPEMNWEVQELMNRSILSFSDAHSPAKMGREATVFELGDVTYGNVRRAIMRGKSTDYGLQTTVVDGRQSTVDRIFYTIEFYPEEGKYHFSGHRNCKVVYGPEDIKTKGNQCPVCKRRLTEGVLYRVQQLADESLLARIKEKESPLKIKWYTDAMKKQPPYVKLVPLNEIVAEGMASTVFSQKVKDMFTVLCETLGSEIEVLLKTPIDQITEVAGEKIASGILLVRQGNIVMDPGYDGEYGKVHIFKEEPKGSKEPDETEEKKEQIELF